MEIYIHAIETHEDAQAVVKQLNAAKNTYTGSVCVFNKKSTHTETVSLPIDDAIRSIENISEQIAKHRR